AYIIATLFVSTPSSIFPINIQILVAMTLGWLVYRRGVPMFVPSLVCYALLLLSIFYGEAFAQAFPNAEEPISVSNAGMAIAAFERKLVTPGRWDRFLAGETDALSDQEKRGFNLFVEVGCVTCHYGAYVGADSYKKLGLVKAWPDNRDRGRYELTMRDEDWMVFKVPSLRNVAETGPYFHDGSVGELDQAIRLMARHQLGKELSDDEVAAVAAWLGALTGELPVKLIAPPELPVSGPDVPRP
ncbi:MAG: cytochrome c peroxidase, partial [Myxococcota bacterium]